MRFLKVLLAVVICLIFLNPICYAASVLKIGVVDFQQALNDSRSGKSVQDEIKKKGQEFQSEIEKVQAELKEFQDTARKEAAILDKDQKQQLQRELGVKLNELRLGFGICKFTNCRAARARWVFA